LNKLTPASTLAGDETFGSVNKDITESKIPNINNILFD